MSEVEGFVAPGFEVVADAFARNLRERGELGAAFAAVRDGEPVVDLWGGLADPTGGRPWDASTLVPIYSGTKGLVAMCLLVLIERGRLALEDPVARHWPEFAAHGKEHVTVAEVVSHRARLPGVRAPVAPAQLADDVLMARLLAAQAPESDPRAAQAYHGLTFGWLCGELIRRVDPAGRSAGRFFAEEVAAPLGLELWIGLPPQLESRVATLEYGPGWLERVPSDELLARDELLASIWANPPLYPRDRVILNDPALHAAEIPGVSAIGSARSVARLYGCLARGGELGGVRLLAPETVVLGGRELSRFRDRLLGDMPSAYGVGFQLQAGMPQLGPAAGAFGHRGAGGSVHAAWPRERVGVSYAMNRLRGDAGGEACSRSLLAALHDALSRAPSTAPA